MKHIYENKSTNLVPVVLPSKDNLSSELFTFGPFGRIELDYPGLDAYVPHRLTKVCAVTGTFTSAEAPVTIKPAKIVEAKPEPVVEPVVEPTPEPEVTPEPVVESTPEPAPVPEPVVEAPKTKAKRK